MPAVVAPAALLAGLLWHIFFCIILRCHDLLAPQHLLEARQHADQILGNGCIRHILLSAPIQILHLKAAMSVSAAAGIQDEPLAERFTSATICLSFTLQSPDKADAYALPGSPERGIFATGHENPPRKCCSGPHDMCSKQQAAQQTCTVSVVLKVAALMVTSQ